VARGVHDAGMLSLMLHFMHNPRWLSEIINLLKIPFKDLHIGCLTNCFS
jgi:hypothetical protein